MQGHMVLQLRSCGILSRNIPSIESTYEAVKVARLVAHIIDMEKFNDFSEDYEIAKQRRSTCVIGAKNKGCARCGEFCPLNLDL